MSVIADFSLPVTAYPAGEELLDRPEVSVTVECVVPVGESTHYIWVAGDGREHVASALRADASVASVTVVDELPGRDLLRFEWSGAASPAFRGVGAVDGRLVGMCGTHEGWTLRGRFPDQSAIEAFYERCRDLGVDLELRQVYQPGDRSGDGGDGLTETQTTTLLRAFEAGYFDIPRRVTLAELADHLGVSEQAVSERLRRGLATLLTRSLTGETAQSPDDRGVKSPDEDATG